jgi:drug/metabolite transporter (DMT)-like permease
LNRKTNAHLAALAANFIFAANYIIVKLITPSVIKPFGLNVVRVLVSVAMFWGLYLLKPSSAGIERKHLTRFILCAVTGVAINQMLFIKGLSLTTSIHASLLSLGTPVFITIIAAWLLKETLTIFKISGLLLAIAGAAILIASKESNGSGKDILLGDILVLINSVSYALFLVLVRPLMEAYSPVHVLRWVFTLGSILILPFGWNQFLEIDWSAFTYSHWSSLAFVVIGATFSAYLLNIYSIGNIGSSTTGTYIYTQPIFAAVIAIIFTSEYVTLIKALSAVLIFAGVFLVNKKTLEKQTGENKSAVA